MPKVRYLKIRFANTLMPYEIPCFRSAVIEATSRQSTLFHNHAQEKGFLYRYPLIQYKVTNRKASLVCLGPGTDDIHYLLQNRQLDLRIGERRETFEIEDIQLRYHHVQAWQARFQYALKNWMALNQTNYKQYLQLETEVERLEFLENLLKANLLSFAGGIDWYVEQPLEARITRIKSTRWLRFKGRKVLCFTLNFTTNVSLPDYVGLGKGVSVGFGSVKGFGRIESIKKKKEKELSDSKNTD
jgi:hypothetical protein